MCFTDVVCCCVAVGGLLRFFEVLVGSSPASVASDLDSYEVCVQQMSSLAASTRETLTCGDDVSGQFVAVKMMATDVLHFCDIEVHGTPGKLCYVKVPWIVG